MDPQVVLAALAQGLVPPGMMYIAVRSPIGSAYVDPFAAAQDARTQQIMAALGLDVELGFGPIPARAAEEPSLVGNLKNIGLLALGATALYLRPRLTTVLAVGVGYLALSGQLARWVETGVSA